MHFICWLVLWFISLCLAMRFCTAISKVWNNLQAYHEEAGNHDPRAIQLIPDLAKRKLAEEEDRKKDEKRIARQKRRKESAEFKEAERQKEEAMRINADHHAYCKTKDDFDPDSKEHIAKRKKFKEGWAAVRRVFKAFETAVPTTRNETDPTLQTHVEIGTRRHDGSRPKPVIHCFAPEAPLCEIPPPGAVVGSTDPNNIYIPEEERVRLQASAERARLRSLERAPPPKSILKKAKTNYGEDKDTDASPVSRTTSGDSLDSTTAPSFEMSPKESCSSSLSTIESEIITTPPDSLTACKKEFKFFEGEKALSHSFIIPGNEGYLFEDHTKKSRFNSLFPQPAKPSAKAARSSSTTVSQEIPAVIQVRSATPRLRSLSADSTTSGLSTKAIQSAEKDPYYAFDSFTELGGIVVPKKSTQATIATKYKRQIVKDRESKEFHAWFNDPVAKAKRGDCEVCCHFEMTNYQRSGVKNHSKCWQKWEDENRVLPEPNRQYQVFDHDHSRFRRIKEVAGRWVPEIFKKKKEEPKEIPAWLMGILP